VLDAWAFREWRAARGHSAGQAGRERLHRVVAETLANAVARQPAPGGCGLPNSASEHGALTSSWDRFGSRIAGHRRASRASQ